MVLESQSLEPLFAIQFLNKLGNKIRSKVDGRFNATLLLIKTKLEYMAYCES